MKGILLMESNTVNNTCSNTFFWWKAYSLRIRCQLWNNIFFSIIPIWKFMLGNEISSPFSLLLPDYQS